MQDLNKRLIAYDKIVKVINSCINLVHLNTTSEMLSLYHKRFGDDSYLDDLYDKFFKKQREIVYNGPIIGV